MTLPDSIVSFIDREFERETAFLAELVKVPSDNPPGDCAAHARRVEDLLTSFGLAVETDVVPASAVQSVGMTSATNLIVRQRFGDGPTIALNAHGDVVPPGLGWTTDPYAATVVHGPDGPAMYGRGAAVSKSDFATYTFALLALRHASANGVRLGGTVELHFTYDEEAGGEIGPKRLLDEGLTDPDFVISAGFSYAVVNAHNGCLHVEVILEGKQAHAAIPESGVDALEAANAILSELYRSRQQLSATRSQVPGITSPTLNIGLIKGGINTNVVPDQVTFRLDRRIIPEESPSEVETQLRQLVAACAQSFPKAKVTTRRILLATPLVPRAGCEKIAAAIQSHARSILGCDVPVVGVPLYTDARHYAAHGIPVVLYGAGPHTLLEANAHSANENIRLPDLRAATKIVALAVATLCNG